MVSALDNEAAAENEDIKARDELEDGKLNEESKKVEPDANSSAIDAETERSAQTKRSLEREMDNLVDDDLFSAQEQEDIDAALKLSREEESSQERGAHGAKARRTAEVQGLTGSELAAKALEDLEAARKELEGKAGSADPAASGSTISVSGAAAPAGSADHSTLGRSSSSAQGATPALG